MKDAYEIVSCPIDGMGPGKRLRNLHIVLPDEEVEDFVWTWQTECMVREHVLKQFRANGFTGFEIKPVTARFETLSEEPPVLWELVVTGWGGLARPESGIVRDKYCAQCKHVHYSGIKDARQLIDDAQWDGSDFFMVWPFPRFIFVTPRVADYIRDHHFTGAVLQPADEIKQSPYIIEGYSPGRLSYWMPMERARELGEAAGIAEI